MKNILTIDKSIHNMFCKGIDCMHQNQTAGGSFDSYCSICGMPFVNKVMYRIRDDDDDDDDDAFESVPTTKWMKHVLFKVGNYSIPATLAGKTEHASFSDGVKVSKKKYGKQVEEIMKQYPKLAPEIGFTSDSYDLSALILDDNVTIIHPQCEHRADIEHVMAAQKWVRHYHHQFFSEVASKFIKDKKVNWLLKEPSKTVQKQTKTAQNKPKKQKQLSIIEALTKQDLTTIANVLQVKKGRTKSDLIKNIKEFVCQV